MTDANDSNWSNDEWVGSETFSYLNPYSENASTDNDYYPHTKPEVSAIGGEIATPSTGNEKWGTSFAAPAVTGHLTLLSKFSDDYGTIDFRDFPEVAKSIIMAGALNDEGDSFGKVGTGCIYAKGARVLVKNDWFEFDYYDESNAEQTYTFDAEADEQVRVVLNWLSNVQESEFSDNKNAKSDIDFDLKVRNPSGDRAAGSFEWDRGYEWVEFTASESGTYTIVVDDFRWDASESSREIGIAWSRWP